jgi:hypothetical protein
MPLLATQCLYCRPPRPVTAAPAADAEPRYSVVRSGNGSAGRPAAAAPARRPVLRDEEVAWYCRIGGQIIGPVTAFEIRDAYTKGQIDGEASIGVRGHKDWYPIKELPQFADLVTRPSAPTPVVPPRPAPAPPAAEPRDLMAAPAPALPRTRTPMPRPARAPPPAAAAPAPVADSGREDDTLVVAPLPPPGPGQTPDGAPAPPTSATLLAWQNEVRRLRGQVRLLLVVSGVLLTLAFVLVGLLVKSGG